MCHTILQKKGNPSIGGMITYTDPTDNLDYEVPWLGFATREKLGWWARYGRLVPIPALGWSEKDVVFESSAQLAGLLLHHSPPTQDRYTPGDILLVTRPPANSMERSVHDRHPETFAAARRLIPRPLPR